LIHDGTYSCYTQILVSQEDICIKNLLRWKYSGVIVYDGIGGHISITWVPDLDQSQWLLETESTKEKGRPNQSFQRPPPQRGSAELKQWPSDDAKQWRRNDADK
jgi:hypothetical protein